MWGIAGEINAPRAISKRVVAAVAKGAASTATSATNERAKDKRFICSCFPRPGEGIVWLLVKDCPQRAGHIPRYTTQITREPHQEAVMSLKLNDIAFTVLTIHGFSEHSFIPAGQPVDRTSFRRFPTKRRYAPLSAGSTQTEQATFDDATSVRGKPVN